MTEKRSKSLSRLMSDKSLDPSTTRSADLSLLTDHDRKKVRGRARSRDRLAGLRVNEKTKENILRDRSKDKPQGRDKAKQQVKEKDKLQGKPSRKLYEKGQDQRKLSKQNTYIFQNGRPTKVQEKRQEEDAVTRLNKSIENLDYSRVVDDISPVHEDDHYTEICENFLNKNGGPSKLESNNKCEKRKSAGDRELGSHDLHQTTNDDDNNLSFTLLKKDIGRYYIKIPGFEVPKGDFDTSTNSDHNKSYDSLC